MADAHSSPGTLQLVTDRGNTTTNNVRIGAGTTPSSTLSVSGNEDVTGTFAVGAAVSSLRGIYVISTQNGISGTAFGVDIRIDSNPASASTATKVAGNFNVNKTGASNETTLTAVNANAESTGGTITNYFQFRAVGGSGAATHTNAKNFACEYTTGSGGTVTNLYGFYFTDVGAAGTTTNEYGVYIENVNRGATTNRSIYIAGGRMESLGAITTTADTITIVPGWQFFSQSGTGTRTVNTDGSITITGANLNLVAAIPVPIQSMGQAVTLQSGTFYFSGVTVGNYIDVNRLSVIDVSSRVQTNLDNDTVDITSGTSHTHTFTARAFGATETLLLELDIVIGGASTLAIFGALYNWDTT